MLLMGRGKPDIPPPAALLRARLVRNQALEELLREEGRLVVSVPVRGRWWMHAFVRWLVPTNRFKRIELDRRGMSFLDLCDGERRVEEIVRVFAGEYALSLQEAKVAVASFIEALVRRGVVVIVGSEEDAG